MASFTIHTINQVLMLKLEYSGRTRSVSWLLMACLLSSLRHHQSWYCICRKNKSVSILGRNWTIYTTSMLRNDEIYIYTYAQYFMKTNQHENSKSISEICMDYPYLWWPYDIALLIPGVSWCCMWDNEDKWRTWAYCCGVTELKRQ